MDAAEACAFLNPIYLPISAFSYGFHGGVPTAAMHRRRRIQGDCTSTICMQLHDAL